VGFGELETGGLVVRALPFLPRLGLPTEVEWGSNDMIFLGTKSGGDMGYPRKGSFLMDLMNPIFELWPLITDLGLYVDPIGWKENSDLMKETSRPGSFLTVAGNIGLGGEIFPTGLMYW